MTQRNANNVTSVVALASRALTAVEQRYSQTEREALAITWAVSHFHLYLYGGPFTVITDHKPLMPLFNNSNAKPSLRLERWILTLQAYDYTVQYQPGKHNPADYMSRHPYETPSSSIEQTLAEAHIHFISNHAIPKSVTRDEIASATKADIALQMCMEAIKYLRNYRVTPMPLRKHHQRPFCSVDPSAHVYPSQFQLKCHPTTMIYAHGIIARNRKSKHMPTSEATPNGKQSKSVIRSLCDVTVLFQNTNRHTFLCPIK